MKKIILVAVAMFTVMTGFAQTKASGEFRMITAAYFNAKNTLSKDKQASADAEKLMDAINKFPVAGLNAEQKKLWETNTAEIKKGSAAMVVTNDIKVQRESFKGISYAMIRLVKGLKMNDQNIFVQHCPMVKSSWLNEVAAIQNPYYGSMMYDCGDVKETIAKQ